MGRGKIEIKRIENTSNRLVTYSKRRNGILKKAKEITVLCDAKVSLIIFGTSGKMHEYCSPSTNLGDILDQYQQTSGRKLWDAKHENLSNEIDRIKKENDNMQIELRHLKGEDITSLPYKELMAIEDALENGLTYMDVLDNTWKNANFLEEEYKQLNFILNQQETAYENAREQIGGGHQDYNSQMPSIFQVQPIQPNLQERK
ncbi:Floral homeotic protein GLOBOSA [Hibiscus syriacus]|uniref:Floral homeotic protein GLOBOSA n=1 Tax=Hibiscus syriacus TaxID=106335 RepID=A0A6A3CP37_HIBSY|nr:Floral homeotic protein GLOBOSA [Hibiscus syriacus]